jgi:hypothetical protein
MIETILVLTTLCVIASHTIYSFLTREEPNPNDPLYTQIYNFVFSHIIVKVDFNNDSDGVPYIGGDTDSDSE